LAFVRTFVASLFLGTIILIKKEHPQFIKAVKKEWKYFILLGIVGIALFNITQNVGQYYTSSVLGGVIQNINPLIILLLAVIFLHEVITRNKIIGMIIGFLGMIVVVFSGQNIAEILNSQTFLGNILMLGSAICWAVYSILNKKVLKKYSALHLTTIALIVGWIILLPLAIIFEDVNTITSLSLKSWSIILYLAIFSSGLTYFLWNYALGRMDASKVSVFVFFVPIIAIGIGVLFLKEPITIFTLIGIVLVLFGIYLTEKKAKKIVCPLP